MPVTKIPTVEGIIAGYLQQLGRELSRSNAEEDLAVAAEPMVRSAAGNVTYGPASIHLRDNITAAPEQPSPGGIAAVSVGARRIPKIGEVFYGRFLEFGTVKQAPRPWLRPAFDSTYQQVVRRMADRLQARVIAAARKFRG